jgi:diguanylate cyclase (GGDEF)-like protein
MSTTDMLTGLSNRRHFYELATQKISVADRDRALLSFAVLDIDNFKGVNDTYGHAAGDIVLKEISRKIRDYLRAGDVVARIGGEEFSIIFQNIDVDTAFYVLSRLRESVASSLISTTDGKSIMVTISAGVTEKLENEGDIDLILSRADVALYKSKVAGRNKITIG